MEKKYYFGNLKKIVLDESKLLAPDAHGLLPVPGPGGVVFAPMGPTVGVMVAPSTPAPGGVVFAPMGIAVVSPGAPLAPLATPSPAPSPAIMAPAGIAVVSPGGSY